MNAIKDLDMVKILHLDMDGPSTDCNVIELINDHQVATGFQKTSELDSYLLKIYHDVFQSRIIKPGWDIARYLKHFIIYL